MLLYELGVRTEEPGAFEALLSAAAGRAAAAGIRYMRVRLPHDPAVEGVPAPLMGHPPATWDADSLMARPLGSTVEWADIETMFEHPDAYLWPLDDFQPLSRRAATVALEQARVPVQLHDEGDEQRPAKDGDADTDHDPHERCRQLPLGYAGTACGPAHAEQHRDHTAQGGHWHQHTRCYEGQAQRGNGGGATTCCWVMYRHCASRSSL